MAFFTAGPASGQGAEGASRQLLQSASTVVAAPDDPPSVGGEIRFDHVGLRPVSAAAADGRLLTGFPVLFGDRKGQRVRLPTRVSDEWSGALNTSLYFDLAVLKAYPSIIEDPRIAYFFAQRFLVGDAAKYSLVECHAGCSYQGIPFRGWRGSNEFEREATYRKFVEQIVPELIARAPEMPLGVTHILEVEVGPYDRDKQSFPLQVLRPAHHRSDAYFGSAGTARDIRMVPDFDIPKAMAIEEQHAEQIAAGLRSDRRAYLALSQRFKADTWTESDGGAPPLGISLDYAVLYADPGMTAVVHAFPRPLAIATGAPSAPSDDQPADFSPGTLDVTLWRGAVLIGGRVAALATSSEGAFKDSALPKGFKLRYNPQQLVRDYALAVNPRFLDRDSDVLRLVMELDPPLMVEVIEEAIQRQLRDFQVAQLTALNKAGDSSTMGLLSSPFEERRAIAALRARADRVIPTDLPPQPIPLRVYCYADLDAYDFETESFPIHDHGCDEVIHSLPRNGAMGVKPPGTMPMRIAMSPTEAEAYFRSELRGNSRVTVSYEIDLVVGTAESDTGTRRTTVLSERRNFLLHARDSLTTALLRIDEPK